MPDILHSYLTSYRASAGSGKTHTLSAEYIARLLSDESPCHRNILAMTFTNKATAEMKIRILTHLFDIAAGQGGNFTDDVLNRMSGTSPELLRERAKNALKAIIHDYDHFLILTIDSFFQRMLTALAHELGLSANFRVDVNDFEITSMAVDFMLENLSKDKNERLLGWIKEYIRMNLDDNGSWKIADKIKDFAKRNVLCDSFQRNKDSYMSFLENDKLVKEFRQTVIEKKKSAESNGILHKWVCDQAKKLSSELEGVNKEKHYDKGKYVGKYLNGLAEGNVKLPPPSVNRYLQMPESFTHENYIGRDEIVAVGCDFIEKLKTLTDRINELSYIHTSAEKTLETFNNLRLLGEISKNIDTINAEHNRILLSRTKWLFSQMVSKSDSPFVFEKMGTQLRHIMIDEFQDTARTQWENIRKLMLENISKGDSCLIVGDVKQSIYRFNGGDWTILANLREEAGVPIEDKSLKTNYRSKRHIVEFNNSFFLRASRIMDSLRGGTHFSKIYDKDDTPQMFFHKEDTGYVRCTLFTGDDTDVLTEDVGNGLLESSLYGQIKRLYEMGVPYSKMAILVRWNKEAEKIASHFSACHPEIPLVSQEAFMLSASPAVMTIVSALRWLHDKRDSVSLTYCAEVFQNRILENKIPFEDIAKNPYGMVPEELVSERDTLLNSPLYECVLQISKFFCFERLDKTSTLSSQSVFLVCFFDEILNFLNDGNSGLSAFLRNWDEALSDRKIPTAETDGISIVTIHKSKGLAFDTVFLPFCDWDIESPRTVSDSWLWAEGRDKPYDSFPPYPIRESKSLSLSTYADDYERMLFQRRVENVNLLYVAFTRAKSNLIIWGKTKTDQDPEKSFGCGYLLHRVMTADNPPAQEILENAQDGYIIYEYGSNPFVESETVKTVPEDEMKNPLKYEMERLPMHIEPSCACFEFLQSSESRRFIAPVDEDTKRQDEYIRKGNLYHRIFSDIRSVADVPVALRRARLEGLFDSSEEEDIRAFIEKCLKNPIVTGWFDGSWTVRNECDIVCMRSDGIAEVKRPDRVMCRDGITVVIDYKFGKPLASHKSQVGRYMELLGEMGHTNLYGYLWYVYDGTVEEVK